MPRALLRAERREPRHARHHRPARARHRRARRPRRALPMVGDLPQGAPASGAASSAAQKRCRCGDRRGTAAAGDAGAAAAGSADSGRGHRCGGSVTVAAAGAVAAAAGAGAVATVGAATGAAAGRGVAAFVAAIPLGAAAAVVGGVALAASPPSAWSLFSWVPTTAPWSPVRPRPLVVAVVVQRPEPSADAVRRSSATDLPTDFPVDDQAALPSTARSPPRSRLTLSSTRRPPAADEPPAAARPRPLRPPCRSICLPAACRSRPGSVARSSRSASATPATRRRQPRRAGDPAGPHDRRLSGAAFAGVTGRLAAVDVGAGSICTDDPLGAQCTLAALQP